ncbi:hypothetical protein [Micromonospora sp. WMMD964]|uniref:hypothetical protein n=1 Tax=Micromonospora sp. WMMD964 TaxID=3016091 RepID=UPI00249BAD72|nr:hypothetical protein [Micromonospora sp. WMMD964]WFF02559.1 hypothetical protein O7616_07330 [Micromonospora sp. WMMD964]
MRQSELVDALREIPALTVVSDGPALVVTVPAIGQSLRLHAEAVTWLKPGVLPTGEPFLQLQGRMHDHEVRLVLLNDDVGWVPPDVNSLLDTEIPVTITDAPEMVAYSDLEREAVRALAAADRPDVNLFALAATLLVHRCAIVGALRLGLRPLRVVQLWHELWCQVGELLHGPFWPDPYWDRLLLEAGVPLAPYEQARLGDRPAVETLTVADLRAMEPVLTVDRADAHFLAAWRQWMKLTPSQVCEVLTADLPEARIEVSLYIEGGGAVSMRIAPSGVFQALIELRLSFTTRSASLDEIRIADELKGSGLFPRLRSNIENFTRSLGLLSLKVYATGDGSVAFARAGYDWDRS